MAAHLVSFPVARFDWRRVGAFSTSLAAHIAAFALVLLPLAPPLERSLQRTIEVSFVDAPPPPPKIQPPPEPEPLRKPPPRHVAPAPTPPQPPTPVAVDVPSPMAVPVVPSPPAPSIVDTAPTAPAAPVGEARQLAYDGPLRTRYPAASVRAHEQGTVLLRVLVDIDGRVERVEIARSSGHSKLDDAAREAVLRGRFKPVLVAGKPTPAWGLVPIEFRLDRA